MLRNVLLSEISDGKLYTSNDMVRADCHDCQGCEQCCHGMGETILLDPYDIYQMTKGLGITPEILLTDFLELGVDRGVILPHLKMQGVDSGKEDSACGFLKQGRCLIHSFRPGICRLFPLGRYYENGGFQYFLQTNECPKPDRTKIKISKWLGIPNLKQYEKFISDWHYFILDFQTKLNGTEENPINDFDAEEANQLNIMFLNLFFFLNYEGDFYEQFYERLALGRYQILGEQ